MEAKKHKYGYWFGAQSGEIEASSLYGAKLAVIQKLKVKKSKEHLVSVELLAIQENDGSMREITHVAVN